MDNDNAQDDLVSQMNNMTLVQDDDNAAHSNADCDFDGTIREDVLVMSNPVFKEREPSSKIKMVIEELTNLQKLHEENGDEPFEKAVIVSQWTSMLNIIKKHVQKLGLKVAEINGTSSLICMGVTTVSSSRGVI